MTNFDYLKEEPQYNAFSNVAISAERIILADPQASIINSRRAMEFAVKWIYSVDKRLEPPYQETLVSLMGAEDFRQFVGNDIYRRMDYIRKCGNDFSLISLYVLSSFINILMPPCSLYSCGCFLIYLI